ncbi:MAG: hypothetical protein K2Q09_10595, partial [Phycisphaerales bacterium]|nr:hypothetical protein [Phycisphaerales bacterium]
GRVMVAPDLSIPGHPEVFAVGDLTHVVDPRTGQLVPGVSPAAIQMGRFAARTIDADARERAGTPTPHQREPFRYFDKGSLATIGRARAVARIFGRNFSGFLAWFLWAAVHIFFLIGFRNRLSVTADWVWQYLFFRRGARLITGDTTGTV